MSRATGSAPHRDRSMLPVALFLPTWMLLGVLLLGWTTRIGWMADGEATRSGVATIGACERSVIHVGMVLHCEGQARWNDRPGDERTEDGVEVRVQSPRTLRGEVPITAHSVWLGSGRGAGEIVRPADAPGLGRWRGIPTVLLGSFAGALGAMVLLHRIRRRAHPART